MRHAVDVGQDQRCEAVVVHRAVAGVGRFADEATVVLCREEIVDAAADVPAVLATAGSVPAGKKRHAGQADDSDVAAVTIPTEAAVVDLPAGEPRQAAVDGGLSLRLDEQGGRALGVGGRLLGK